MNIPLFCCVLSSFIVLAGAFGSRANAGPLPKKILVTGAAGRTGNLVFSNLLNDPRYEPVGLVRSEKSAKKLAKDVKCGLDQVCVCDITKVDGEGINSALPNGIADAEAMIICTSAVPKLMKRTILKQFLKVPLNVLTGKKPFNFRGLRFRYQPGQQPEKVDFYGQVSQINLAKKLGISRVVLVSSMGGTDPDNFLNVIGKDENGNGDGDILLWKRKAEKYLVKSGLDYTIIHPGGLTDTPGGVSKLVLDVDDKLMVRNKKSISRMDVANLCIASLSFGKGIKISFDCVSEEVEQGIPIPP
eukprot:CAMPEP_0184864976 /NCGR_PEP_ID=MMETSP0580-20130426/16537_1 /TAXON_ID=1118495 /ORGANISM="Dactyliosolen fragilissimus" /LENGTH=300 /DNA_ID=CAMNT_0027363961 /DNA_START=102 /DNA_END=1001 /DNA_ORIENTATION=+